MMRGDWRILPQYWHWLGAFVLCPFVFASAYSTVEAFEERTRTLLDLVSQAQADLGAHALPNSGEAISNTNSIVESANWPLRMELNGVLLHAGDSAQAQGVALRAISVSHQAATVQSRGRVTLEFSASGRYSALKAWQAAMQKHPSSPSVQSLRLQGNSSSGSGELDAQAIWVLHVRD